MEQNKEALQDKTRFQNRIDGAQQEQTLRAHGLRFIMLRRI
jgi:hypothetical protein